MTKIYQAFKKQGEGFPNIAERLQRAGNQQLYPQPHESQQEEFSKLSLRLLSMKDDHQGSVIAVASSASGEGASFVSYNLANFLGLVYEQKVVWIDGNTRSPQEKLKHSDCVTFVELLKDPSLVNELPCQSSMVSLVPGGHNLQNERALFADRNYGILLESLAARFDFIIIDTAPVLESQDAALMAQKTDGLLLVVAHRKLKHQTIGSGVRSLQAVGVNLLGAVLNRREFDLPGFLHKWI